MLEHIKEAVRATLPTMYYATDERLDLDTEEIYIVDMWGTDVVLCRPDTLPELKRRVRANWVHVSEIEPEQVIGVCKRFEPHVTPRSWSL